MQNLFASQGDNPVNWTMAEDIARRTAEGSTEIPGMPEPSGTPGDPAPTPAQTERLRQAAQVAAPWLDSVVTIGVRPQRRHLRGLAQPLGLRDRNSSLLDSRLVVFSAARFYIE